MTKKISKTTRFVMKKIKKQEVKMRPRAYFVAGSMLLGAGVVGVMMLAVLFTGMVFFRLRMQGALGYLRFGSMGLAHFVKIFPWRTVGLAGIGLMGGSYLLRKQGKTYKIGLGWLVLGVIVTVLGLGLLIDKVGVNEKLQKGRVKSLYEMRFKTEDWLVGEVAEIGEKSLLVVTPAGEEVKVSFSKKTKMPAKGRLGVGDKVRAMGEMKDGVFEAEGIMPGGLRWDSPPPRPGMNRPGMMRVK